MRPPALSKLKRSLLVAFLVLSALIVSSGSGQAKEVRLTLDEARGVAARLLQAGRAEEALVLAQGILIGAPGDVQALLLKARAEQSLGRHGAAKASARLAWDQAENDHGRYFSAVAQASTLAADGQNGIAQYWLRRAAQIAPDNSLRKAAVQDFRQLRQMTPWRVKLGFTFAPSDNINRGTNNGSQAVFGTLNAGLPPLSGLIYGFSSDFSYRYALSENRRLKFGAGLDVTRVELSDNARDIAATRGDKKTNHDFSETSLSLSTDYEMRGQEGRWIASAGLALQHNIRAGEAYSNVAALSLAYGRGLGSGFTVTGRAGARYERLVAADLWDLTRYDAGVTLSKSLSFGKLSLDTGYSQTHSNIPGVSKHSYQAAIGLAKARPVLGMLPRLSLRHKVEDFDEAPFVHLNGTFLEVLQKDTRKDETTTLSVDVFLPKVDFYGFAPEFGVSYSVRDSNYTTFDSESTDLRLSIKSVF